MVQPKARKEASFFTVALMAVAVAVIGVLLGFANEVSRSPVFGDTESNARTAEAKHSPLFPVPTQNGGNAWERILRQMNEGEAGSSGLVLSEGDLNQISREYLNFSGSLDGATKEEKPSFALLPETPVFVVRDETLQVSLPLRLMLLGTERTGILVVKGTFLESSSNGPRFAASEAWVNSARVPTIFANQIIRRVAATYSKLAPDSPLLAGWNNLANLKIENEEVALTLR